METLKKKVGRVQYDLHELLLIYAYNIFLEKHRNCQLWVTFEEQEVR